MNGLAKLTRLTELYPRCVACALPCEPHRSCCTRSDLHVEYHMHAPLNIAHGARSSTRTGTSSGSGNGSSDSSVMVVVVVVVVVVLVVVVVV